MTEVAMNTILTCFVQVLTCFGCFFYTNPTFTLCHHVVSIFSDILTQIVKEPQEAEQSDTTASTGQDGFLTKVNGSTEVGNDLAEVGSDVTVE